MHPEKVAAPPGEAARGALLDVATTLHRLDFQVGTGDYADTSTIGDEVRVKGHLVLTAK